MLTWVLVFMLNGEPVKSKPMLAEACIMQLLILKSSQAPYCVNPQGHKMLHPGECETIKGWPLYCKVEPELALK